MFDSLKAMGTLGALMKNKDKIAEAAKRVKDELARLRVEGVAGGSVVRAVASGEMKILSIDISPALGAGLGASDADRAMASALIAEAVNEALAKARDRAQEMIRREAQALGLPDIPADIGGLLR